MFNLFKSNSNVKNLNVMDFKSEMTGQFVLIDVRTPNEYKVGNIKGSKNIPLNDLEAKLNTIGSYKDKKVLVYCRSGARSANAARILDKAGFNEVYNLKGGYISYSKIA